MNKSDLIIKIANINPELYQKDASKIINVFFKTLSFALSKNERVELRDIFTLETKIQKARTGRNPKTNEKVEVSEKKSIKFKMSQKWFRDLNNE